MQLHIKHKEYDLVIFNDELYSLNSADNTTHYNFIYISEEDKVYRNLSQHSIKLIEDGKTRNSLNYTPAVVAELAFMKSVMLWITTGY